MPRPGSSDSAPLIKSRTRVSGGSEAGGWTVTVTMELIIRPEDREEFFALTKELRLIFLRNGAFLYRVDEILEHPGTFRMEIF